MKARPPLQRVPHTASITGHIMHLRPLISAVVFAALLFQAGCAALRPAPQPLPVLIDPAAYVQAALSMPEKASLSGIARIAITVSGARRSYKSVFACRYPDLLRLEILGLFNQPGLYISAHAGRDLTLYVPSENAWYAGPASPESMQRISGIRMNPFDIVRTIHGRPPGPDPAASRISCAQDGDSYACRLTRNESEQHVWISPASGAITRSLLYEGGETVYDIRYRTFQQIGDVLLPETILLLFERNAASLEIRLQSAVTDPVDPAKLLLQAPAGTPVMPLQAFFAAE